MRKQPLPQTALSYHGSLKVPSDEQMLKDLVLYTFEDMAWKYGVSFQTIKLHMRRLGITPPSDMTWSEFGCSESAAMHARYLLEVARPYYEG